jgi:hypothetical protein
MRVLAGLVGRKAARETSLAGVVLVEISIWIWSEPGTSMMGLEMVEPRWAWGIVSLWPSRTRDCAVGKTRSLHRLARIGRVGSVC